VLTKLNLRIINSRIKDALSHLSCIYLFLHTCSTANVINVVIAVLISLGLQWKIRDPAWARR